VSALEDPFPAGDWESFRAARDRFLARVRPEAMDDPPASVCPGVVPKGWTSEAGQEHVVDEDDAAGA
jgi:hypothetical protein